MQIICINFVPGRCDTQNPTALIAIIFINQNLFYPIWPYGNAAIRIYFHLNISPCFPYLSPMPEKKLFLLDALALIYRAYYALIRSPRITSKGRNTNAQFGFTTTLLDLINKEKPTHLAVVFDTSAPTERHTDFTAYKANRQDAPEDLTAALPDIKRIIKGFNLPCLELDGFEADDIIGTLAIEAADLGYTVYMVTPDKDYGQIVRERVYIYKPGYQGGNVEIMGEKEVCEKWGIKQVSQVVDMLGLMGDAVDNIPGIPGIGEKTAAKLLAEYGTMESLLENAAAIKGAVGDKVRNGRDMAIMSKKLATIITNVPVPFHEEDFRIKERNVEALTEVFNELEFRALAKRVFGEGPAAPMSTDLFGNPIAQKQLPTPAPSLFDQRPQETAGHYGCPGNGAGSGAAAKPEDDSRCAAHLPHADDGGGNRDADSQPAPAKGNIVRYGDYQYRR